MKTYWYYIMGAIIITGAGLGIYHAIRIASHKKAVKAVANGLKMDLYTDQIRSIERIMDSWKKYGDGDQNKLAYILATARHESRLRPVREGFAKTDAEARALVKKYNRSYAEVINDQVYYGRGFVQLTWEKNYQKMSPLIGVDLVKNPDKALEPKIAADILVYGMMNGKFTRKRLSEYINEHNTDFYNARKTVNGTDRAERIKGYADKILAGLQAA